MAKLTDTLASPDTGRRPIDAPNPGPSFVSSLARFGAQALNAVNQLGDDADKRRTDSAMDDATGRWYDIQMHPPMEPDPNAPTESSSQVPGEAVDAVDELLRTQRAASQGRVSLTGVQARTEQMISDLFQQYPDQRYELSVFFLQNNVNHPLLRGVAQAEAEENFEIQLEHSARETAYKAAAAAGLYSSNQDDMIQSGRGLLQASVRSEAAQRTAEEARKAAAEGRADAEFRRTEADRQVLGAATGHFNAYITPLMQTWRTAVAAAGTDADKQKVIQEIASNLGNSIESYRSAQIALMRRANVSQETINSFNSDLDLAAKGMRDTVSGDLSQFQASQRSLAYMQTKLKLDNWEALQVYNEMSTLLSPGLVNSLFSDDPNKGLSQDQVTAIQEDLSRFRVNHGKPEGRLALVSMASVLRGETRLDEMDEAHARAAMPSLYRSVEHLRGSVADGTASVQEQGLFANGYGNLVNAAIELQPGNQDASMLSAAERAIGGIATPQSRQALEQIRKTDPERADLLTQGSRLASIQIINATRGVLPDAGDGVLSVIYDPRAGRFVIKSDRAAYDRLANQVDVVAGDGVATVTPRISESYEAYVRRGNPILTRKMNVLNGAIEHLRATDKYDPNLPTGLTPLQLRAFWATGQLPPNRGTQASSPDGDAQFEKVTNELNDMVRALPGQIATDAALSVTNPQPGFEGAEAQWQLNENNAGGITDVNGATVRFGVNAASHPEAAQPGFTRERAQQILKTEYWDAIGGDNLPQGIARMAFEAAGVTGVGNAKKWLKASDGDINRFAELQEAHYRQLAESNPAKYGKYLEGWLKRLEQTRIAALRLESSSSED